jgi:hypothetical protein
MQIAEYRVQLLCCWVRNRCRPKGCKKNDVTPMTTGDDKKPTRIARHHKPRRFFYSLPLSNVFFSSVTRRYSLAEGSWGWSLDIEPRGDEDDWHEVVYLSWMFCRDFHDGRDA